MKHPTKLRAFMIIGMSVLFVGMLLLLVLPKKPLELSKEEGPFPSISMPPQAVYGYGYMDGGSVGILIIDHAGMRHELTFPIDYEGIRNPYPTAFAGNMNDSGKMVMKYPERAKKIAIRLLDEFGKEWIDPKVDGSDYTARARRALASPPDVMVIRGYDQLRRTFGF